MVQDRAPIRDSDSSGYNAARLARYRYFARRFGERFGKYADKGVNELFVYFSTKIST